MGYFFHKGVTVHSHHNIILGGERQSEMSNTNFNMWYDMNCHILLIWDEIFRGNVDSSHMPACRVGELEIEVVNEVVMALILKVEWFHVDADDSPN